MKNKLLSTLLIFLVALGYSVESSAQNFYLKTHNAEYISCNSDGVLAKGSNKQVWTVSTSEGLTYISTEVGGKTLYLTLDASQIANNSGKITSKFIAAEGMTNIYLFDGSKSGSAAGIVTSVAADDKCYLVSPKITTSTTANNGYYIFRHDYNTSTPVDAKLMVTGSTSDSYKLSVGDPFSNSTITVSTNSNAHLNTQVIFETTEVPSVKTYYGKVELIGVNSTVIVTTQYSAPSAGYSSESSDAWNTSTSGEAKSYYFYSKANADCEFVCYATDSEGKNPITSTSSETAGSTNNYKYKYAVTPAASEDEGNPTTTTIYAVYKQKSQETKCYGTVTAAIASNSTDGGTVAATSSYSTPSDDKYTAGTSSAVRNADSGSKMHLYLFAKAAAGYEFKGWSTNADGSGTLLTTANNYYQVEFDATSTNEASPTDGGTYYAVFEKESEPELSGTDFYLKTHNDEYISCNSDGVLAKGSNKQVWTVSEQGGLTYISTEVGGKTLYLKLDESQIVSSSGKVTSKFIAVEGMTNIYLFDGSKSGSAAGIVTSVSADDKCYLVSPKITTSTTANNGYYIFRHDYNTTTPVDAKLMVTGSTSDSYKLSVGDPFSTSTITVSTNSNAHLNTQVIFETTEVPSVKTYYGKVELIGVNSTVIVTTQYSAPSAGYSSESSDAWNTSTSSEAKSYYFYSKAVDDSEFVCYATDSEGKNPITSTSSEAAASSNNYKYKYAVTPAASEDEGNPTTTTIYAVYKQKSQETKYYGTVTAAIASNSTDGGTVAATSSYSTPSDDKYTAGTSSAVRNAASGSKMHLYLFAKAAAGYEFKGWSTNADGSGTLLTTANDYYQVEFDATSTNEASPTDGGTYYAVFEKESEPEFSETKCFLMNGANYIGYANGVFTTSTTDKQEWEFGTTSNFITPLSTLVNNQVNYLGYTTSAYNTTGQYMDLLKEDNSSVYFFDATTGKPASALEVGKSYYIVLKSTNSGSSSRYVVSCEDGTLKTTKASTSSGNYVISNATISSDVTLTLGSSVKAACTFTLASAEPAAPSVKYGKVTLAAAVSNGTYSIESGATSGELITSEACAGAATTDIVLSAEANAGYVFNGWSVDGGATILSGSNAASYTYTFSFSSEDSSTPTEVTITPVFEKLPELFGTKCFLMNGDNYIGYANGAFTSSTTDKQEWAFGTTSDFITPLSTLVNNQVNYLGYPTSVGSSTTVFADVISSDNNSLYFFDTETNKPASSLEVGKSYYIVIKSSRSESTSRYVVSYENGTLKTTKASTSSGSYIISNTTISSDVTLTLDSSVKAACTFTLASTAPVAPTVKYGKVTLAASVSNGTYSITSGAASGELITSEACAGAATTDIVLSAQANAGYVFKGWSVDGGATILSGSNAASYTYTFSFSSEDDSMPTEVTLTPVFEEIPVLSGTDFYLKTHNDEYISCNSDGVLSKGSEKQVWTVSEEGGLTYISTTVGGKTLYLKLDESQIASNSGKVTSKFIAVEEKTNIYLFDGSKSGTAAGIVTSVAADDKCYLVSPKITTSTTANNGYYIFRHDYNDTTPIDAKLMSSSSSDYYRMSENVTDFSKSTITINSSSSDMTQVIFEKTETPSTKTYYGTLTVVGTNGTVFASTDKEATSGEATVNVNKTVPAANATETIYLNAAPNDKYAFLGWSETEGGEIIEGSNVEGFAYTFTFDGTEDEPTEKTLYAVFDYKYTTYYGTFNVSAGEGGTAFFAAETGATEGSVTEDVNEEVLKTVTSASKTFYLNATAPSDKYEFLGWSETEGGEILEGSNVEDFAYTFTFDGTEDEPTAKTLYAVFESMYTTYYGTFNVSAGEGGKAFFAAETGATEGKVTEAVNEEVLKTVTSVSKTYYLNATPSDKYDFLGWAETEGGEILEGSNVEDFEYTFTFDGTEDEPTVKTLYAVFENKYTTYCGTFNVSAGEGGTAFIAEASGATEGSVTEAVTKVVDKTETSASKTFYLNATAKSGYTFKGWSETEDGEIFVGTNDKDFEYTFTFDGTEDKRTVKTLYAVFEDTKPGDVIPSTDITAYDNILYFNDESTSINRDFNLVLNLKNAEENVTAFQCDVCLPRGIDWEMTTDKNGNEVLKAPAFNTERTDETYHNVTCKRIDGRTIRIIVISTNKDIILGTEGAILTLPLSVADDMEGGDYNIFINNIVIATDQQEQTTIDQTVSKVSVADFNLGDVNSDGKVNVTDVVAIVAYMLNESPTPFVFKAADVHADNEINVTDIVGLIDIINMPESKAANAANGMRSGSYQDSDYALDIVCNGQNVTLNMDNRDNITAFQCDVELSEGVEWVSANGGYAMPEFNKEAGRTDRDRHNISVKRLEDGKFRLIVYSLNNDEFFGSEGAVLNLPLVFTKDASCTISNIVLSKKNADSEYLNGSTYSFDATSIDYIKNAQDANDVIFNINGVRNNKLMKGVNIINGVKVMVNE